MIDPLSFHLDHRTADMPPGEMPGMADPEAALWSGEWAKSLSEARLLENLYLVAAGIRRTSFFHPVDEREVLLVRQVAESIGLGMAVRKAGSRVLKVYLYGPGGDAVTKVPDIDESVGEREFIMGQIAVANMTGKLMDYPPCCISSFVNHLMAGTDQDAEASRALGSAGAPSPDAYFFERFVPCFPACENAAAMGARITSLLKEKSPHLGRRYEELKHLHMEEVRSGEIVKEKRIRGFFP